MPRQALYQDVGNVFIPYEIARRDGLLTSLVGVVLKAHTAHWSQSASEAGMGARPPRVGRRTYQRNDPHRGLCVSKEVVLFV